MKTAKQIYQQKYYDKHKLALRKKHKDWNDSHYNYKKVEIDHRLKINKVCGQIDIIKKNIIVETIEQECEFLKELNEKTRLRLLKKALKKAR
jgi:hypothetical protein